MAQPWTFGDERYRTIDESRIVELFLLHGWAFELRAGRRAAAEVQARATLHRLVVLGLQHRRSQTGSRLFDPVETLNLLRWAGLHRGEPAFKERCVATERMLVAESQRSRDGQAHPQLPEVLKPARYAVTIRRTFNLSGSVAGARSRLRLPLPLNDAALSDLQVEFLPPHDLEVETVAAPGRLDVLAIAPTGGVITVGVKFTFAAGHPIPDLSMLAPDQVRIYTRPSEGLIKVSERVARLASELAGVETDSWALARRFTNFMLDNMGMGNVHYDQFDPEYPLDTVLDQGWYDCNVGSALFVALCRARGIPARVVGGYTLHVTAPYSHNWIEVWLDGAGWRSFDLSNWSLSAGGKDAAWRDYYFGHVDHRMIVERLPFLFAGTGTVRLPPAWHMVAAADGAGCAVEFLERDSGALIYREYLQVERNA